MALKKEGRRLLFDIAVIAAFQCSPPTTNKSSAVEVAGRNSFTDNQIL